MRILLAIGVLLAVASAEQDWSKLFSNVERGLEVIDAPKDLSPEFQPDGEGEDRHHHHHRYPHRPKFCGNLDCPRFRLMKEYRGYELRCYPPYHWVSTKSDTLDSKDFVSMFKRLHKYIKGYNSKKEKIPMKLPVAVTMKYNISDHKTKSMMSFFLFGKCCPFRKAAKPLDPKVFLKQSPEFCAYVRSFDGWVMSRSWSYYKQLWYLSQDLKRDGKDKYYHKGLSVYAGYNAPWQLFDRHNEVWRIFKCPHCNKTEGAMEAVQSIISFRDMTENDIEAITIP